MDVRGYSQTFRSTHPHQRRRNRTEEGDDAVDRSQCQTTGGAGSRSARCRAVTDKDRSVLLGRESLDQYRDRRVNAATGVRGDDVKGTVGAIHRGIFAANERRGDFGISVRGDRIAAAEALDDGVCAGIVLFGRRGIEGIVAQRAESDVGNRAVVNSALRVGPAQLRSWRDRTGIRPGCP